MNKRIPRPPNNPNVQTDTPPNAAGFGRRSIWPLPPVGEAARRDPHIPDPVPNSGPSVDQRNVSPPVAHRNFEGRPFSVGDGVEYNGLYATVIYIKRLGNHVTRSLARNHLAGAYDARWRVGGVSLPPSSGPAGNWGMGYHGDAATVWPNNPQTYMRNPGIRPLANVPQTYRYAPNMATTVFIQDVGPSIGDFGSQRPPGTP